MTGLVTHIRHRLSDESGVVLVEYAILLAAMLATLPALLYLAGEISDYFEKNATLVERNAELIELALTLLDERIARLMELLTQSPP